MEKLEVKIKRTHKDAVIPKYATAGSAGLDFTAVELLDETPDYVTYDLGCAVEIPKGYVGLLFPRSSIRKYGISLSNSVGVIDSDFRGSMQVTFYKNGMEYHNIYNEGDRCVQLIILPYPQIEFKEVDELSDTVRGEGGFGSTNK